MSSSEKKHPAAEAFSQPRPTRTRMLTVRLTAAQDELLKTIATEKGMERAEIVRAALDLWIRANYPAGSKGTPPGPTANV